VASSLEAYFATGENSAGSGLANYSNRGFYTFGRNVFEGAYPLPRDFSLTSEVLATPLNMAGSPLPGKLTFMKGSVPDSVRPELTVNARLSTVGAWNQFLTKQESFGFSLNYYNYDDQAALLIPRAVGYSAGFINHFFRGKLEITLPKDNVYAIGDTADPAVSDVSMGFSKLKLNIRNISSGLGGVPALQASGSLRAVVKFHRNKCYLPDFSGEYGSPGKSTALCRDPNEEIVVSSAISAPVEMNASPQEVTFIFPRHIPIGASDFYLQVVYRGPLGEDSDAIAMGTKDISEPTFHTVVDIAEQFVYGEKNETFRTYFCDHASPPITFEDCKSKYGHSVYLRFSAPENFDPNDPVPTFGAIASWAGVNVSQYGRIVYLTDLGPRKLYALSTGQNTAPPLNYAVSERNVAPYQFDKSGSADQPPLEWQQQRGAFFADFISSGPINPAPDFVPGTPHVATLNFMDTVASKTTFTAPAITSTSASSMGQSRTGTLTSNMSAVGVTGDQQDDSTVAYDGMLSSKPVRRP
jgi:hypothetical protein